MTPIEEIPTGVTVDGRPLEVVLQEMEDDEKGEEILLQRQKEITNQKKCRTPIYRGMKYKEVREPNGKVRKFTLREIRRRYGPMMAKTATEKIADLLRTKPRSSLSAIQNELQLPMGTISGALSQLNTYNFLDVEKSPHIKGKKSALLYSLKGEYGETSGYDIQKILNKHKSASKAIQKMNPIKPLYKEPEQAPTEKEEVIKLLEKILNLKVEVSGSIEIKFVLG